MTTAQSQQPPRQPDAGRQADYGTTVTNLAEGNAHVALQAGVIHGDAHVYQVRADAPPAERYRKALNFLHGGVPRQAESLIRDVVADGFISGEVLYYWVLAVLSNRAIDHLGDAEFDSLRMAFREAERQDADGWRGALDVIYRLIDCLTIQEQTGEVDPVAFDAVLVAYGRLPGERRDEIRRHLEMILAGGVQDQLEARDAEELRTARMAGDRVRRVWKFFEPVPAPPRARIPLPPQIGALGWAKFVASALLLAVGVVLSLRLMSGPGLGRTVGIALVWAAGGAAVGWFGPQLVFLRHRRAGREREHGSYAAAVPEGWVPPGEFIRDLELVVDRRFAQHRPVNAMTVEGWAAETTGVRATLRRELTELYCQPDADVGSVDWLVNWYATETARRYTDGTLYDFRRRLRLRWFQTCAVIAGWIALGIGALWALVTMLAENVAAGLGIVILLGFGVRLAWRGGVDVYLERRRYAADRDEYAERLQAERRAYDRWVAFLADRPSDAEMGRWLDYDEAYIKSVAMRQYGLSNRDIIAHVVLTEGAPDCRRARVLYGPPRYSAYIVLLFLFTEGGVRQVAVNLDFTHGLLSDERRTTFRYDAIASARVDEVGVRFDSGRRRVVRLDGQDAGPEVASVRLLISQAFQLSLVSGQRIDVVLENFDRGFIDRTREDPRYLFRLALDASGINSAIRILEAVAAEGREWIARERLRRQRRLRQQDWDGLPRAVEQPDPPAIGGGPGDGNNSSPSPG